MNPPAPHPLLSRRPYAALPLGWAAVVLVLTLTPADEMPRTPDWELLSFDTAAHAGVFVVLALLSWFSVRRQRRWPRLARHAGLAVFVGSTLFGGLIEVLQYAMHMGRHGDWVDLLSDAIGSALAVGVATTWASWQGRSTWSGVAVFWLGLLLAAVSPSHAQDIPRARKTIEKLASPGLHGRGYVQQGEHKAAAYLRTRLRELKLEPLAPDYTQPFTLDVNTFPGEATLQIDEAIEDLADDSPDAWLYKHPLQLGTDFIAAPESGGISRALTVFISRFDTLALTNTTAQQHFQQRIRQVIPNPLIPKQRGLVITAKEEQRLQKLPASFRQTLDSMAVRVVLVPKLTASLSASKLSTMRFEALDTLTIWKYHVKGPEYFSATARINLDAQLQRNYQTQNLAAVIRGTAQPDSFVVVSAHYDHLGMMGKNVYFPGANDNASGVALLLELAAHYARPENRPACSVVFLLFGAEEAGLVGSSYFVAHPLIPLKSIKFLVNLDLLGTGEQGATVVNGRVFEAPYRRLVALNDAHHYLPALAARGRAANSDHYPFSEAGVPAFFIYTRGGSTAYHDVNDRPEALSLAGFAGAFGLVRDFLNEEGAAPAPKK